MPDIIKAPFLERTSDYSGHGCTKGVFRSEVLVPPTTSEMPALRLTQDSLSQNLHFDRPSYNAEQIKV